MYDTLCIAGGGIKILPFIGILQHLINTKFIDLKLINKIIGVSSGSILALMLILDFNMNEIIFFFNNFDFKQVIPNSNSSELLFNYGMEDSSKLNNVLKTLFIKKKFKLNYSFLDLYNDKKKQLVISVTNLTKKRVEYWNYLTKPDTPIIQSIIVSCCYPIIFKPIKINNYYYVDGGLLDNFPIQLGNKKTTLGLVTKTSHYQNFENFIDYCGQIINLTISSKDIAKINLYKNIYNIISVKNNTEVFDFNLSKKKIKEKIYSGNNIAKKFLKKIINKIKRSRRYSF